MLKLFPANHLALTDTLYTVLNMSRIRCSKSSKTHTKKNTLKIKLNF
jgi:hypothetical protein